MLSLKQGPQLVHRGDDAIPVFTSSTGNWNGRGFARNILITGKAVVKKEADRGLCSAPDSESLNEGVEMPTAISRTGCVEAVIRGARPAGRLGLAFKLNYAHISLAEFIESYGGNHKQTLKTWLA